MNRYTRRALLQVVSKPVSGRAKLLLSRCFQVYRLGGSLALPVLKRPLGCVPKLEKP